MTQWWEITIPVAGTLSGVLVTSWLQNRAAEKQRRYDREGRFYEEKKAAYLRYPALAEEVRHALTALAPKTAKYREAAAESIAFSDRFVAASNSQVLALQQIIDDVNRQTAHLSGEARNELLNDPKAELVIDSGAMRVLREAESTFEARRSEGRQVEDKVADSFEEWRAHFEAMTPVLSELSRVIEVFSLSSFSEVIEAAKALRGMDPAAPFDEFLRVVDEFRSAARRDLQGGS